MIADILSQLDKVKRIKPNQWIACCPAHKDKTPSLAIRELDDGRILMKCMAECPIDSVLGAMGLEITDLFPKRLGDFKREKQPFSAAQLLQIVGKELTIVALCASTLIKQPLEENDKERLVLAINRINKAIYLSGVQV